MDTWEDGSTYDGYMGRWSRLLASEFVRWLGVPPKSRWLDVGGGTGALAEAVAQETRPASVAGIDPSRGFIETATTRLGIMLIFTWATLNPSPSTRQDSMRR